MSEIHAAPQPLPVLPGEQLLNGLLLCHQQLQQTLVYVESVASSQGPDTLPSMDAQQYQACLREAQNYAVRGLMQFSFELGNTCRLVSNNLENQTRGLNSLAADVSAVGAKFHLKSDCAALTYLRDLAAYTPKPRQRKVIKIQAPYKQPQAQVSQLDMSAYDRIGNPINVLDASRVRLATMNGSIRGPVAMGSLAFRGGASGSPAGGSISKNSNPIFDKSKMNRRASLTSQLNQQQTDGPQATRPEMSPSSMSGSRTGSQSNLHHSPSQASVASNSTAGAGTMRNTAPSSRNITPAAMMFNLPQSMPPTPQMMQNTTQQLNRTGSQTLGQAYAPAPLQYGIASPAMPSQPMMGYNSPQPFNQPYRIRASALAPFVPQLPEEVAMNAGDIVTVIQGDLGDGWTTVENSRGQTGLVPTSYIKFIG